MLRFAAGAAPLALLAMAYNLARFGSPGEFGHSFLYDNRVNADIDTHGLFSPEYLARNLEAAFLHAAAGAALAASGWATTRTGCRCC